MAEKSGILAPLTLLQDPPTSGLNPATLDYRENWTLPVSNDLHLLADHLQQAKTDTQPVAEPANAKAGHLAESFAGDWYNRIHINPNPMDLGNLVSDQTRDVEIWNAHFTAQTLQAVTSSGAEGVSVNPPLTAPTIYGPLQARTYSFAITLAGPPTIAAAYTLDFGGVQPRIDITGARVIPFSIRSN